MGKKRWLTRDIVVETAVQLVNEAADPHAVTLTAVAKALNVRLPSLYNHIAHADDLQEALALYAVEKLLHTLRTTAVGHVGTDALRHMAHTYRHFAHANPGLYPLILRAPATNESDLAARSEELLQLLLLVLASCGLQGEEALHMVRGFRAVLHGFVSLEQRGGYEMPLARDESFTRLVEAYLRGALSAP